MSQEVIIAVLKPRQPQKREHAPPRPGNPPLVRLEGRSFATWDVGALRHLEEDPENG